MAESQHIEWLKEGVEHWNARRRRVKFSPDLSGFDFSEILPWDYRETPKASKYFEKINLKSCDLRYANLSNLNFHGAKFDRSNLDSADLSKSNFSNATFRNCSIRNGNLTRSDFTKAVFVDSDLIEASLDNAILPIVVLMSADRLQESERLLTSNGVSISRDRKSFQAAMSSHDLVTISSRTESVRSQSEDKKAIRQKNTARYDVYFGTNRTPEIFHGAIIDFDGREDSRMHYGLAEVFIPNSRPIGQLGKAIWAKVFPKAWRLESEIGHIISLDETLFWNQLLAVSKKSNSPSGPTIFIHGFNTSFAQSIVMAAELGHDLGIGAGIGCFSWPSKGHPAMYAADEATSESSKHSLADFIESFQANCDSGPINLVAHSMGTRCLVGAIEILANRKSAVVDRIGNVILAAADFDTSLMSKVSKKISASAKRVTSYASDKDNALRLSAKLHSNNRVGYHPPVFVELGIDTIVVNSRSLGKFGHQYVVKSRTVLADIFSILKHDHAPKDRHSLVQKTFKKRSYWEMRE